MPRFANRRFASRLIFIIGLLLLFLGSAFVVGSPEGVSQAPVYASFLLVALGVGCAMAALRPSRRPLRLFLAALFFQAGLFFFFGGIGVFSEGFGRIWPLLSVFSGVAILPAGWQRYGAVRANYVVLSAAFVILGSVLMVFSLDVVDFSFAQFILDWWALLVLMAGLVLVLAALGSRRGRASRRHGKRGGFCRDGVVSLNSVDEEENNMKHVCDMCGYEYDPAAGDPDGGVQPGTAFNDIPEDWLCPDCGVGKESFSPVE